MGKIWKWSFIAALSGFLFGFDTVVISGADKILQNLWDSSDVFHGLVVMGMALWGTLMGALLGGMPTNKLGRKRTLILVGMLFSLSAVGSALANDPFTFAVFRFIGGLGVGASTIAAPAYISEIAPAQDRGRLVGMYQFNIVFGIVMAFLSNYLIGQLGSGAWRWMLGVEAIPAMVFTALACTIPKSPRWSALYLKSPGNPTTEAERTAATGQVNDLKDHLSGQKDDLILEEHILLKKYRFPLVLAFLIAFFNQFSGINAFLYYAPRIFEEAGMDQNAALFSSIGIGVTNLLCTLVGIQLIDRVGRKILMYVGSIGYIISLSGVSLAFLYGWGGPTVVVLLLVFIGAHAVSQGTVIWVFISEIFPDHLRASGQAFGSSVHWILAAIIPSMIPLLFTSVGAAPVFGFFALMMFLQLLFVVLLMPETKGIRLGDTAIISMKRSKPGIPLNKKI